jgi:sigma-B regulation protein RsbU (phosphoserine phosphatase)
MDFEKTVVAGQRQAVGAGDEAHFLLGVAGPVAGERHELGEGALILGRRPDVTVRLDDPAVSGQHCRGSLILDQLIVEDLRSTNGTYLDDEEVTEPSVFPIGSVLQVGNCAFKHELRSRDEVREEQRLAGDLAKAANYVKSLLPAPIDGEDVSTEWRYTPSDNLGGDAFGYHWMDDNRFAVYLADVSGHGTAPALHAVAVINVLRKQSLPGVDFTQPAQVLKALNEAYLMRDHANMYFTLFYGVYDRATRTLSFGSAGHPPSLLLDLDSGRSEKLMTPNLSIGMIPGAEFTDQQTTVPENGNLYIYSDGAYEVVTNEGEEWRVDEFLEVVAQGPRPDVQELDRIEGSVRDVMQDPEFDDDFSLVVVSFS